MKDSGLFSKLVFILGIISLFFALSTLSSAANAEGKAANVIKIRLSGSINPGMLQFFRRAVKTAGDKNADMLLVELDTPGGLIRTLREMIQTVMSSPVPVVVYVAPSGAQAASAGALFTMAAHVAAMAPGTNIGAAHPVIPGGGDKDSDIYRKMENDVAALARGIAKQRGRNAKWAEDAVRESVSATADEALKLHIIDFVAPNESDLFVQINGKEVKMTSGLRSLKFSDYVITELEPGLREKIMGMIADPDIAYILMMLGAAGLYFEFAHPGAILPGTVGAISLILGLFAMQVLPVNITGILLLVLAMALFLMELFITSHGILAAAGIIAMIFGSMMIYDTSQSGIAISPGVLWTTVGVCGVFFMSIAFLAAKAQLSRHRTGSEALVGEHGVVRERGRFGGFLVFVQGELWKAESETELKEGDDVEVVAVEGMKLRVRPLGMQD